MRARRRRVYFPEKQKNGEKRDVRTSAFIGSTKRVDVCLTGFKRPPIFLPAVLAMKILSLFFFFIFLYFLFFIFLPLPSIHSTSCLPFVSWTKWVPRYRIHARVINTRNRYRYDVYFAWSGWIYREMQFDYLRFSCLFFFGYWFCWKVIYDLRFFTLFLLLLLLLFFLEWLILRFTVLLEWNWTIFWYYLTYKMNKLEIIFYRLHLIIRLC